MNRNAGGGTPAGSFGGLGAHAVPMSGEANAAPSYTIRAQGCVAPGIPEHY
jgi:hypothetical protein